MLFLVYNNVRRGATYSHTCDSDANGPDLGCVVCRRAGMCSQITLTGLRLVNCRTVGDVRVLENSPAVECGTTGQVFATAIGVALLLVFTVATPVNVVLVYRK